MVSLSPRNRFDGAGARTGLSCVQSYCCVAPCFRGLLGDSSQGAIGDNLDAGVADVIIESRIGIASSGFQFYNVYASAPAALGEPRYELAIDTQGTGTDMLRAQLWKRQAGTDILLGSQDFPWQAPSDGLNFRVRLCTDENGNITGKVWTHPVETEVVNIAATGQNYTGHGTWTGHGWFSGVVVTRGVVWQHKRANDDCPRCSDADLPPVPGEEMSGSMGAMFDPECEPEMRRGKPLIQKGRRG